MQFHYYFVFFCTAEGVSIFPDILHGAPACMNMFLSQSQFVISLSSKMPIHGNNHPLGHITGGEFAYSSVTTLLIVPRVTMKSETPQACSSLGHIFKCETQALPTYFLTSKETTC